MPIQGDLSQIKADLETLRDSGYQQQVEAAVRYGQSATREFIERLHPATAFGGHDLLRYPAGVGTDNLIQKGSFKAIGTSISANIYANMWARWYNTGVYIHGRRKKMDYPNHQQAPRGTIFASNATAIEDYFSIKVQEYLKQNIKIRS